MQHENQSYCSGLLAERRAEALLTLLNHPWDCRTPGILVLDDLGMRTIVEELGCTLKEAENLINRLAQEGRLEVTNLLSREHPAYPALTCLTPISWLVCRVARDGSWHSLECHRKDAGEQMVDASDVHK